MTLKMVPSQFFPTQMEPGLVLALSNKDAHIFLRSRPHEWLTIRMNMHDQLQVGNLIYIDPKTYAYSLHEFDYSHSCKLHPLSKIPRVVVATLISLPVGFDNPRSRFFQVAWSMDMGKVCITDLFEPLIDISGAELRPGILYKTNIIAPAFTINQNEVETARRVCSLWFCLDEREIVNDPSSLQSFIAAANNSDDLPSGIFLWDNTDWRPIPDEMLLQLQQSQNSAHVRQTSSWTIPHQQTTHNGPPIIGREHVIVVRSEVEYLVLFSLRHGHLIMCKDGMTNDERMDIIEECVLQVDIIKHMEPILEGINKEAIRIAGTELSSDVSSMNLRFESCPPNNPCQAVNNPPPRHTLITRVAFIFVGNQLVSKDNKLENIGLTINFKSDLMNSLRQLENLKSNRTYEIFLRIRDQIPDDECDMPFEYHCMFMEGKEGKMCLSSFIARSGNSQWIRKDRERRCMEGPKTESMQIVMRTPSFLSSGYTCPPSKQHAEPIPRGANPNIVRPGVSTLVNLCGEARDGVRTNYFDATVAPVGGNLFPLKPNPKPAQGQLRDGKPPSAYVRNDLQYSLWEKAERDKEMKRYHGTVRTYGVIIRDLVYEDTSHKVTLWTQIGLKEHILKTVALSQKWIDITLYKFNTDEVLDVDLANPEDVKPGLSERCQLIFEHSFDGGTLFATVVLCYQGGTVFYHDFFGNIEVPVDMRSKLDVGDEVFARIAHNYTEWKILNMSHPDLPEKIEISSSFELYENRIVEVENTEEGHQIVEGNVEESEDQDEDNIVDVVMKSGAQIVEVPDDTDTAQEELDQTEIHIHEKHTRPNASHNETGNDLKKENKPRQILDTELLRDGSAECPFAEDYDDGCSKTPLSIGVLDRLRSIAISKDEPECGTIRLSVTKSSCDHDDGWGYEPQITNLIAKQEEDEITGPEILGLRIEENPSELKSCVAVSDIVREEDDDGWGYDPRATDFITKQKEPARDLLDVPRLEDNSKEVSYVAVSNAVREEEDDDGWGYDPQATDSFAKQKEGARDNFGLEVNSKEVSCVAVSNAVREEEDDDRWGYDPQATDSFAKQKEGARDNFGIEVNSKELSCVAESNAVCDEEDDDGWGYDPQATDLIAKQKGGARDNFGLEVNSREPSCVAVPNAVRDEEDDDGWGYDSQATDFITKQKEGARDNLGVPRLEINPEELRSCVDVANVICNDEHDEGWGYDTRVTDLIAMKKDDALTATESLSCTDVLNEKCNEDHEDGWGYDYHGKLISQQSDQSLKNTHQPSCYNRTTAPAKNGDESDNGFGHDIRLMYNPIWLTPIQPKDILPDGEELFGLWAVVVFVSEEYALGWSLSMDVGSPETQNRGILLIKKDVKTKLMFPFSKLKLGDRVRVHALDTSVQKLTNNISFAAQKLRYIVPMNSMDPKIPMELNRGMVIEDGKFKINFDFDFSLRGTFSLFSFNGTEMGVLATIENMLVGCHPTQMDAIINAIQANKNIIHKTIARIPCVLSSNVCGKSDIWMSLDPAFKPSDIKYLLYAPEDEF